jgi:hypothetical protein
MIRAVGYSSDRLRPFDPGRLCRGRERWIEPFEPEGAEAELELHRLVITGAAFSDDSAEDAQRGLPHGGVDLAALIADLFPGRALVAFMEDGHPADIPEQATGVEAYEGHRAGGAVSVGLIRWHQLAHGRRDDLVEILGDPPDAERVRGFLVLPEGRDAEPSEEALDALFLLVGMSTLDSPPARYQPAALPEALRFGPAVILLHRDKHGPALGIYSAEPTGAAERLEGWAERQGALLVPFAIPPMLARWDRAIAELRSRWMETRSDEFPVPPAPEPPPWRGRGAERAQTEEESAPAAEE